MGKIKAKRIQMEYKMLLKSQERYRWYTEMQRLLRKGSSVIDACRALRISRSEYYYWHRRIKRLDACRKPGHPLRPRDFLDLSRRPHRSPKQCTPEVEKQILKIRKKTNQGAEHIQITVLEKFRIVLSVSAIYNVVKRAGLIKERKYHQKKKSTVITRTYTPGEKIQVDTKYVKAADGTTYYQYGAIDMATGIIFKQLYKTIEPSSSTAFLRALVLFYPFPIQYIQTDNGFEYTWRLHPEIKKIHPFTIQCQLMALEHVLIPPASPTFNSKIERTHRIDMEELWRKHPRKSFQSMQLALKKFVVYYNQKRRTSAKKFLTPLELAKTFPGLQNCKLIYPVLNVSN